MIFFIFSSYAQDVIYTINREKIEGNISEITSESIRYKPLDYPEGPIRNIPLFEVYMVKFENGIEEFFKQENPTSDKKERFFSNKKNRYFSIAAGIGQSYGGIGIRLQGRIGNIQGVGFHGGVGYYPKINDLKPGVWVSAGCKFFIYKAWYLNLQFGSVAQYKAYKYTVYIHPHYAYGTAYGPSVLFGGDWFFNKHVGMNGALGAALNVTQPTITRVFVAFDFGLIVKF